MIRHRQLLGLLYGLKAGRNPMGTRSTLMPLWHVMRGGLDWLLYDTFQTADAAPITSPRTCEPGPGTLTVTGNALSIANDRLVIPAPSSTWEGVSSVGGFTLGAGLAIMGDVYSAGAGSVFGITFTNLSGTSETDASGYSRHRRNFGTYVVGAPSVTVGTWAAGKYVSVIRGTEGVFFIRDGSLVWVAGTEMTDHASTIYATIGSYNAVSEINSLAVIDLPANGYTDWDADFSTITDSETNPANGTTYSCDVNHHQTMTFTFEATNYARLSGRYDGGTSYGYRVRCVSDLSLIVQERQGEAVATLHTEAGVFADGVVYQIDAVCEGSTLKVYVNNVLKTTETIQYNATTALGGVHHDLDTNDIVITTHPYPALGIATSRIIAPQAADTATHTADCLMVARNVNLPTGGSLQYELRKVGSDEITLDIDSNGKPILKENATAKITGANGNISEDDDVVVILDGANASLFSDGTQIGSTVTDLSLTAGTTFNMASIGTAGSTNSVELWPRDVSSILPTELV